MGGRAEDPPPPEARDEAIRVIDAAYVDGQLAGPEYDARVAAVVAATDEIQLKRQVVDLQTPPPDRRTRVRTKVRRARTAVSGMRAEAREEWAGYPRWLKVTVAGLLLALLGPGVVVIVHEAVTGDESAVVAELPEVALGDLVDAYAEEFGTTLAGRLQVEVGSAGMDGAEVDVPVNHDPPRVETWRWRDDEFTRTAEAHGSTDGRVDLAHVDIAVAEEHLAAAWTGLGVPEASTVTVVVDAGGKAGRITFSVRNDFDESGRLVTDLAGTEVAREPFVPPGE